MSALQRASLGSILLLACSLPARGDGLIRSLPEDGRWVKFHGVLVVGDTETNGDVLLRSVGKEDVAGKPARWIELETHIADTPNEVYKLLVREEHLRAGFDPIDHIVRGWQRTGEADAVLIEKPERIDFSIVGAMLHAPIPGSETGKADREFPWQRGTLKARPTSGRRKFDERGRVQGSLAATVWPHADVPFGVAGLRVAVDVANSNTAISVDIVVTNFGKDAKSVLPDAR